MLVVLLTNLLCAAILGAFDLAYALSFEVAFIGTFGVVYSSYLSVLKKVRANLELVKSAQNAQDSLNGAQETLDSSNEAQDLSESKIEDSKKSAQNAQDSPSKKGNFLMGLRMSFGLLRIVSYAFIGLGMVALINNDVFAVFAFLFGVLVSSLASAVSMIFKH